MRILLAAIALAASLLTPSVNAAPHDTTLHLKFERGGCSGTAVGPSTVLTASHCLEASGNLEGIGDTPVQVESIQTDNKDHALIRLVGGRFATWSKMGPMPKQGAPVFMYGNPLGIEDIARIGWYIGERQDGHLFQLPNFPGDSGSGIFDKSGRVVAVLMGEPWRMNQKGEIILLDGFTIAQPFAFTAEQWKAAAAP